MGISRMAEAIMVSQLLATAAAVASEPATGSGMSTADDGRDLASKLGIRRLLQDGDCIPPVNVCCSNCGWFERTNCCDPDNFVCSYNPITDPGYGQDWCMPRNWDDIPKYFPGLFPPPPNK